jgi:hypothetical protein
MWTTPQLNISCPSGGWREISVKEGIWSHAQESGYDGIRDYLSGGFYNRILHVSLVLGKLQVANLPIVVELFPVARDPRTRMAKHRMALRRADGISIASELFTAGSVQRP